MNILLTGAGGFIGGHLVKRLKKEGYWVRGVDLVHHEYAISEADDFVIGDLNGKSLDFQLQNKFERIVVPFTDGKKTMNIVTDLKKAYESNGKELINDFEKNISLAIINDAWKTHLRKMDELKQSVQLAVHEQKDPLLIYKFEAKELFFSMIDQLNKDILTFLFKGALSSFHFRINLKSPIPDAASVLIVPADNELTLIFFPVIGFTM